MPLYSTYTPPVEFPPSFLALPYCFSSPCFIFLPKPQSCLYEPKGLAQYWHWKRFLTFSFFDFKESVCERGRRAEGTRESSAGSTLHAEYNAGLNPRILRLWPEPKSGVRNAKGWTTQMPQKFLTLITHWLNIRAKPAISPYSQDTDLNYRRHSVLDS